MLVLQVNSVDCHYFLIWSMLGLLMRALERVRVAAVVPLMWLDLVWAVVMLLLLWVVVVVDIGTI